MKKHIIDCDALPSTEEGWTLVVHQKGGLFKWSIRNVELYLSPGQHRGCVKVASIRKWLKNKTALNAAVLDYLLANQHLIPQEWKDKKIAFWGSIYRADRELHIRCLRWFTNPDGQTGKWAWFGESLHHDFLGCDAPAALRAN